MTETSTYDVTFNTRATFIVNVEAEDRDTAEDLVADFSPTVNWGSVGCVDLGYDPIDIGGM